MTKTCPVSVQVTRLYNSLQDAVQEPLTEHELQAQPDSGSDMKFTPWTPVALRPRLALVLHLLYLF